VLNLASQLGGGVASVPSSSVTEGIKSYLGEARATQLIVGKSARSRWFEWRRGSIVDRLVRETPGVAVQVLPLPPAAGRQLSMPSLARGWGNWRGYALTLLMTAGVTAFGSALFHVLDLANVALLYLLPVMFAASLFGLRTGIFAGVASSLAYNFFFLPPTGTLTVTNPENIVTIFVLLAVAAVTSQFGARVRAQADLAAGSARQNAALAGFLRQVTATANDEELMQAICAEIGRLFDVRTVLLKASPGGPLLRAAVPPEDRLETIERAAAQWVLDKGQAAGRGSDTLTASDWLFHPLKASGQTLGALGMARDDGRDPVRPDRVGLLMSLLDQSGLLLERLRLQEEMREVAQLKERDRLRAALLSSVSHDLKTPLTAILGAIQQLRHEPSATLLDTVDSEAQRLHRFVANLLDMARVEAGALQLNTEATDLTDAIASAVHDTRRILGDHPIELDVAPDLPLVRVDPQLFHHCLMNLLDNAGRYADPGSPIRLQAERRPEGLVLSVLDIGPGLPADREQEVFETFRRFEGSDRSKSGTGLGLAIVKGFAEAMGLKVMAANRTDARGACFSLHFPPAYLVREQTPGAA
jgi:two-component system sensor histidine kinase KdpD